MTRFGVMRIGCICLIGLNVFAVARYGYDNIEIFGFLVAILGIVISFITERLAEEDDDTD